MAIVKNEEQAIRPMLASVKPFISAAVIGDTGSTDGTIRLLYDELQGIPHRILRDQWVNFAYNRNIVLEEAFNSNLADYWLSMDADEVATLDSPLPEETHDLISVPLYYFPEGSWAGRVVRSGAPVQWKWPIHEVLWSEQEVTRAPWPQLRLTHTRTGHRGLSNTRHHQNEKLLRAAVKRDPKDTRMLFYLARELDKPNSPLDAAAFYKRRAQWQPEAFEEEGWYAHYRWGACLLAAGDSRGVDVLLRATERRPHRAEPFATLATHYYQQGQDKLGLFFACRAEEIPYPKGDSLFIELALYDKNLRAQLEATKPEEWSYA